MYLIPFAVLLLACNLCVLTAIAAGRAYTGWARARWLVAEFVLYVVVFWSAIHVFDATSGLFVLLALFVGSVIGLLLAFVDYMVVGLRGRFGADLRGSLWLGRFADPFCAAAPYPTQPTGRTRA